MKYYKNKDWLKKRYINEKMSTYRIAEICNCNSSTIWRNLKKFGILVRTKSESLHLSQANHCNLIDKARQWIDGELLGDGCLHSYSKYSACFCYSSKYLEYINYVTDILNSFGIKQAGSFVKEYNKEFGKYVYHYCSLNYVELLPIRKRWYPNGKKIIPRDLKLTPLLLRQEYISDGSLRHRKIGRPYVTLCTIGFLTEDVKWLVEHVNKLGFKATKWICKNVIQISAYSTEDFLDYIGECPVQCYQYKWEYNI